MDAKLKAMTDDELDNVSGGTNPEGAADSRFLNVLLDGRNGQCDRYGSFKMSFGQTSRNVERAWASVGVRATIRTGGLWGLFNSGGSNNTYSIDGRAVSRDEAMQHAMDVVGKQLKESDWNW